MAGMHHALMMASRIAAALFGVVAFYAAFFLYEDERGILQNRLEELWVEIYDRAKVTDSTSIALFNKISEVLSNEYNKIFGKKLISQKAVHASISLSVCGATVGYIVVFFRWLFPLSLSSGHLWLNALAIIVFGYLFYIWLQSLSKLLFIPGYCVTGASIFTTVASLLLLLITAEGFRAIEAHIHRSGLVILTVAQILIVALSIGSDYFVVVFMRKLFSSVAASLSRMKVAFVTFLLVFLSGLVLVSPIILLRAIAILFPSQLDVAHIATQELVLLNITTSFICFMPAALLFYSLLHRCLWPMLGRLLYPLASDHIVTERRVLLPIGALAFTYATHPKLVGLEDIIKLIHH